MKKHSSLLTLGLLIVFAPGLSGCSLLLVAQGETRYVPSNWKNPPSDTSLASQLAKGAPRLGLSFAPDSGGSHFKYQVQKGDSLWSLSKRFYGKGSAFPKIEQDNGLDAQHPFRAGSWLVFSNTLKNALSPGGSFGFAAGPRPKANRAFAPGEKLKFEVRALSLLGGYATLQVGGPVTVEGRPCLSLTASANSAFPFSAVYPVKDVQTSYFDAVDYVSWKFENNVQEGGYKARNQEQYHQLKHELERRHNDDAPQTLAIAPFSQDIISCFYYFRLLDLKVGGHYAIPTSSGGKNYQLYIDVLGKERVTVPAGTFDCLKARPMVKSDTVFRNKEDIVLWVTDDARHIPVLVQSAIVVGNITISLLDATLPLSGTSSPLGTSPETN